MYRVNVTPVVGLPQFGGWSQVVSSNFSSSQLVCAFSIFGDHAGNAGRDLAEKISQATATTPKQLQQLITDLLASAQDLGVEMQLAGGVFTAHQVILGTVGGSVFLKRGDRTGILLSSAEQIKIVEGKRVEGDVVVLITQQATNFISEIKQKFARGFETDSVVTSIIPGLHGLNDSSLSSIAFITGGSELDRVVDDEEKPGVAVDNNQDHSQSGVELEVVAQQDLIKLGQSDQDQPSTNFRILVKQKLNSLSKKITTSLEQVNWRSILVKLVGLLSRLKKMFLVSLGLIVTLFRKITAQDIYLKKTSRRRFLLRVPIAVAVVLIGSLIGWRVFQVRKQLQQVQVFLEPIVAQLDLAKDEATSKPILAREAVSQAILSLEQLEKDFVDQKKARQLVSSQLVLARELYDQISGQEEFGQLEIFYDLRLVDGDFVVSALDATDQQVAFLDVGKKKIITLDLKNKQTQQFDLSQSIQVTDLELTASTVTVLANGVVSKDLKNGGDVFVSLIKAGDSNRHATLIESFATYIYILNPEKRNIYRYAKQKDGYSDPIGWVSGAAGFDYQQVSSWAIDGEVWVATRNGELHKLATGREQQFAVVGLAEPFTDALQIFTNDNLKNLYILEPANKRLVVLNKKGEFIKEIKSESLSSTTSLFVSEKLGKAFAVSGSIVYAMSI